MGKMLENDPIVDSLLAENPFRGKPPPKHVRARLVDVLDSDDDVDVLYISLSQNTDFSKNRLILLTRHVLW